MLIIFIFKQHKVTCWLKGFIFALFVTETQVKKHNSEQQNENHLIKHVLSVIFLILGLLRLLLGLQFCRGTWGPAGQEDRSADWPQPAEPGGLCQGEWWLWRRVHDQRLQLCGGKRRHRLWGSLPICWTGEKSDNLHLCNAESCVYKQRNHFLHQANN